MVTEQEIIEFINAIKEKFSDVKGRLKGITKTIQLEFTDIGVSYIFLH